jgi:hypothetical protein
LSARASVLATALLVGMAGEAGGQNLFAAADSAPRYERYGTPAACVAAVRRLEVRARWGQNPDTLPYNRAVTLPPAAVELARSCLRRFRPAAETPDSLARRNAPAIFRLAAMVGNDSVAASSLESTLSEQRLKADSLDLLFTAAAVSAAGRPVHLALARTLAARLDRLGAVGERATGWWMSQHQLPLQAALAELDSAAIAGEAAALLANIGALPKAMVAAGIYDVQFSGVQALAAEMLPAINAGQVDSAVARLIRRGGEILTPGALEASRLGAALPLLGKSAPPLAADFWFGRPAGDTLFPRSGRVTLVQYLDSRCSFCDYSVLRRLKQRFGDRLDLVLVVETKGHFRSHPPLDPAREAELLRAFYLDFHRLPAILAVSTTPFTRHPAPDRRRVDQKVPAVERYRYGAGGLLVDRRGILVFPATTATMRESEALVGRVIEVLLR